MGFENNVMIWSFQDAKDFVSTLIKIIKENLMGIENTVKVWSFQQVLRYCFNSYQDY